LLTGNCGPNIFLTFSDAGILVVTGLSGQVRQALHKYISWGQDNATANDGYGMKKNGAEVIRLATGMLVGYPPCRPLLLIGG